MLTSWRPILTVVVSRSMRRRGVLTVVLVSLLAATAALTRSQAPAAVHTSSAICIGAIDQLTLVNPGELTVGTDNPAYPPWFGGTPPKGSKWKVSDPASGKGFESAVVYAVANYLGFPRSSVTWIYTPFNKSFAPGNKAFDFDINEISYTLARAKVVSFSASYYNVNQAIAVVKGTKIAAVRSVAGLRSYKLGAQLGTTSYAFIKAKIKPTQQPSVFPTNAGAVQALKNKQIDGLVVDLPTAFYVTAVQVPNSKILGQFPTAAGGEHFGMVFQKGNSLVGCVNQALAHLRKNGQLKSIQQKWLAKATGAPVLR
jgi:polar amino acid transport system substrate-binding protein